MRIGLPPHVYGGSSIRIPNFLNPLSRVEIFEYACIRNNSRIFLSHDVTRSSPVLYRKYSRWLPSAMFRFFNFFALILSFTMCVQLNPSIITVLFWGFFPCWTDKLDAINKLKKRTNAWWDNFVSETLKIKFSHEPRITFQISWRAKSESGYVWTSKFDLNTTCGGENFWIRKEKVQVQIQKYPDTCERAGP